MGSLSSQLLISSERPVALTYLKDLKLLLLLNELLEGRSHGFFCFVLFCFLHLLYPQFLVLILFGDL